MWRLLICSSVLPLMASALDSDCRCLTYSRGPGGTFQSPDYPSPCTADLACVVYIFLAETHQIVELNFVKIHMKNEPDNCEYGDRLLLWWSPQVMNATLNSPADAMLCGATDTAQRFFSSGHAMRLAFTCRPTYTHEKPAGFFGYFRFVNRSDYATEGTKLPGTECDYQFVSSLMAPSRGSFFSPGFPAHYPRNSRCGYRFRARSRQRVRITFLDVSLDPGDNTCLSPSDSVEVLDGRGSSSPSLVKLCGAHPEPQEVLSSGQDLYVEFQSTWNRGQGFRASFSFDSIDETVSVADTFSMTYDPSEGFNSSGSPAPTLTVATLPEVPIRSAPCNSHPVPPCDVSFASSTALEGTVFSPGHPNPYPPRTICRYDFTGRGRERVQITFLYLSLFANVANPISCDGLDRITAYSYSNNQTNKIANFCGLKGANTTRERVMSSGPRLYLEFLGQHSGSGAKGFAFNYSFTEDFGLRSGVQSRAFPCAFIFNSSLIKKGSFQSPNYPGIYPQNTECHYFFHGKSSQRVRILFQEFLVEGVDRCTEESESDFVEISNIIGHDSKFSRLCGRRPPFNVTSYGNFFRVAFKSNAKSDGIGFYATFNFEDVREFSSKPVNVKHEKDPPVSVAASKRSSCCQPPLLLSALLLIQELVISWDSKRIL